MTSTGLGKKPAIVNQLDWVKEGTFSTHMGSIVSHYMQFVFSTHQDLGMLTSYNLELDQVN